jgi:hypothetical protein
MPRYEILHDYRSGRHGPWEQGAKIELTEEEAEWVNRDSVGTLVEIPPLGAESETKATAKKAAAKKP